MSELRDDRSRLERRRRRHNLLGGRGLRSALGGLARVRRSGSVAAKALCAPATALAIAAVWATGLAALGLSAPPTALARTFVPSPTTGNPKGVRLAHEVMSAFRRISAYRQSERHFFQIKYQSKTRQFAYRFGKAHRPGFVWATENSTVRIQHGRLLWWRDTLTPVSGHRSPVMIVLDKNGRYTAFGTPAHHSCFTKLPRTSTLPYRYDGLGYSIGGRIEKPQRGPTTVVLPYVYRWEQHLTATENDTIRRATKLVISGNVDVTRHDGSRVFAFEFANTYPRTTPAAPTVKLCGR